MSDAAEPSAKQALAIGLTLGVLCAIVAALPAAFRAATAGASLPGSWALLSGSSALLLGPFVASILWLRASATRLSHVRASFLGLLVALGPLAVFGRALKIGTHHRPLGGATFAVVAAVVVALSVVCVRRLLAWSEAEDAGLRRAGRLVLAVVVGLGAIVAVLLLVRLGLTPGPFQAGVLDGLRALGLGAIAAFLPLSPALLRAGARFGLPIWAGVVMTSAGLCQLGELARAADRAAPVLLAPLAWCSTGLGGS